MRVRGKYTSMPFTGIPTFLRAPLIEDPAALPRDSIGIIGIPFDEGTTYRPGSRFGPRAIREASMLYSYWEEGKPLDRGGGMRGLFDIETKKTILADASLTDLGDVPVAPASPAETHRRITECLEAVKAVGVFPLVLGGDHSITFPVLLGLAAGGEKIWVLQLDSHMDYMPVLDGSAYTHASPMKLAKNLSSVTSIVSAGVRGLLGDEDILEEALAEGGVVVTAAEILGGGDEALFSRAPKTGKCYVTIDIDVFDPALAPGTGTPEPGGLGFRDVARILARAARDYEVIGFDIVEVNPLYDHSGRTALLAARTALDFLGAINAKRGAGGGGR
jgi:agmatinase